MFGSTTIIGVTKRAHAPSPYHAVTHFDGGAVLPGCRLAVAEVFL